MKFLTNDFFSKCDKIRSLLRIWSHLLKKILNVKLHFLWSDIIFSEVFNPFLVNVTILHSLKKPEMKKFSAIFKGVKLEY